MTKKTKIMKKNEDKMNSKKVHLLRCFISHRLRCLKTTFFHIFHNMNKCLYPIKGTRGFSAFLLRHHMIGYSIETDYAYAPWPSTSIYNSKTSQKVVYTLNTSCISRRSLKSKALKKKNLISKPLDQLECDVRRIYRYYTSHSTAYTPLRSKNRFGVKVRFDSKST